MGELAELLKAVSALVWTGVAAAFLLLLREPLGQALGRLERFEGYGVSLSLRALDAAVQARPGSLHGADIGLVADRVRRDGKSLSGAEILWIDDEPSGNRREARVFEALGARLTFATSSAEAERALAAAGGSLPAFHLVISDVMRHGEPEGLSFLRDLRDRGSRIPVVFYVGRATQPPPEGADGIADSPDALTRLVLDALSSRTA